ncbi:MAG: hypothetical protein HY921_10160 [Elusimicrobia bacterium]|nr:hypothetical protein [Elusimicrobiota bacterium]
MCRIAAKNFLLPMLAMFVSSQLPAAFAEVPVDMVGSWKGSANIIVAWCKQKELPIEIEISLDGNVSGRIGEAVVENGRVSMNNRILVWLGNPKNVISADLKGAVIGAEGIVRKSIQLLVNLSDQRLVGGFHTSGSKFGGKDAMMMSGSELILLRQREDSHP